LHVLPASHAPSESFLDPISLAVQDCPIRPFRNITQAILARKAPKWQQCCRFELATELTRPFRGHQAARRPSSSELCPFCGDLQRLLCACPCVHGCLAPGRVLPGGLPCPCSSPILRSLKGAPLHDCHLSLPHHRHSKAGRHVLD